MCACACLRADEERKPARRRRGRAHGEPCACPALPSIGAEKGGGDAHQRFCARFGNANFGYAIQLKPGATNRLAALTSGIAALTSGIDLLSKADDGPDLTLACRDASK